LVTTFCNRGDGDVMCLELHVRLVKCNKHMAIMFVLSCSTFYEPTVWYTESHDPVVAVAAMAIVDTLATVLVIGSVLD